MKSKLLVIRNIKIVNKLIIIKSVFLIKKKNKQRLKKKKKKKNKIKKKKKMKMKKKKKKMNYK